MRARRRRHFRQHASRIECQRLADESIARVRRTGQHKRADGRGPRQRHGNCGRLRRTEPCHGARIVRWRPARPVRLRVPLAARRGGRPCAHAHVVRTLYLRNDRRDDGLPAIAEQDLLVRDRRDMRILRRDESRDVHRLCRPVHERRVRSRDDLAHKRRRARVRAHRYRRTDVQRAEDGETRTRGGIHVQDHTSRRAVRS